MTDKVKLEFHYRYINTVFFKIDNDLFAIAHLSHSTIENTTYDTLLKNKLSVIYYCYFFQILTITKNIQSHNHA